MTVFWRVIAEGSKVLAFTGSSKKMVIELLKRLYSNEVITGGVTSAMTLVALRAEVEKIGVALKPARSRTLPVSKARNVVLGDVAISELV